MDIYQDNNIFAKILRKEIPNHSVYENDDFLVFMDVMPVSIGHCLILPKSPSRNLLDANPDILAKALPLAQKIAKATKIAMQADGIIIQQFNETSAGQTVFHLHIHIIPTYVGKKLVRHAEKMADSSELKKQAKLIAGQIG
jgi:histidine triad (HIT) family protein